MKIAFSIVCVLAILSAFVVTDAVADGVMRSTSSQYPGDFLRLRSTRVDVKIIGDVALTTVEQEFVNEWHLPTDAVYGFPLPPDARATDFLFWSNDTLFRAVLKQLEQVQNPGTGEGGIAALLTKYLGSNALRVLLKDIPAHGTQRIELHYISLCDYHQGTFTYRYPLNTSDFVTYPVETVSFAFHLDAPGPVISVSAPGSPDANVRMSGSQQAEVTVNRSKVYPRSDQNLSYAVATDSLGVSFFSAANDTLDGHFALFLRPRSSPDTSKALAKNIVFVLDQSSSTAGPMFDGSVAAIKQCLHRLAAHDRFNIITFAYSPVLWQPAGVIATLANITSAETFLDGLVPSGGSYLPSALQSAFTSLSGDTLVHSILLFSDGRSASDPVQVRNQNSMKAGIFPVGIGDNVARRRLEMLAYENYGFPTFLSLDDNLPAEIVRLFDQINFPVLVDARMEMGSNVYDLLPVIPYAVYEGSRFMIVGRYKNAVAGSLSIAGTSRSGDTFYNFRLPFSDDKVTYRFAEALWAKEKIDQLEREVAVHGATDALKRLLVTISLRYNIRCIYTAYVAEKTQPVTGIDEAVDPSVSGTVTAMEQGVVIAWTFEDPARAREVNLYRAESADGPFVKIGAAVYSARQFVDATPPGTETCYKIEIVLTDGRSLWSNVLAPGKTGSYALYQNFPNPCNPATTIRYLVPGGQPGQREGVMLRVYDVLGRCIRTLVHGEHQASGLHEVVWDGRDERGSDVSSGVYFYRLTAGSFASTRSTLVIH
jgi:Ca-activated chloride channel homolog